MFANLLLCFLWRACLWSRAQIRGQTAWAHIPDVACVWGGVTSACLSLFLYEMRLVIVVVTWVCGGVCMGWCLQASHNVCLQLFNGFLAKCTSINYLYLHYEKVVDRRWLREGRCFGS